MKLTHVCVLAGDLPGDVESTVRFYKEVLRGDPEWARPGRTLDRGGWPSYIRREARRRRAFLV